MATAASAPSASSGREFFSESVEAIEARVLLEAIHARYGFDFRDYAPASVRRRLARRKMREGLATLSALQERILRDPACMDRLLLDLSIRVSTMFRDPPFFRAFRERVVPLLRTYPSLRIWHAGCAEGEEVYSLAILLQEEGIYDRTRLYATDLSEAALRAAEEGIFPLCAMKEFTTNYLAAGGTSSFSDYYTARYENAIFREDLRRNIVFSTHNLATDGPFQSFHAILCRNVVIYFNRSLQDRVYELFARSLCRLGVLALGAKETLRLSSVERAFDSLDEAHRLYRKMR